MALDFNEIRKKNNINANNQSTSNTSTLDFNAIREKNGINVSNNSKLQANPVAITLQNASVIQTANDVKQPTLTYEQAQQIAKENNIKMPNKLTLPNFEKVPIKTKQDTNAFTQSLKNFSTGALSSGANTIEYFQDNNAAANYSAQLNAIAESIKAGDYFNKGETYNKTLESEAQKRYEDTDAVTQRLRNMREKAMQETQNMEEGLGKKIAEGSFVVGDMLPAIGAGAIAGPVGSSMAIYGNAAQNAYQQAIENGATHEQASNNAMLSGGMEAGIEMLSGGALNKLGKIPGVANVSKWTKGINNKFLRGGLNLAGDVIGEGLEEVISGRVQPFIDRITYNPEAPMATFKEDWENFSASIIPTLMFGGANVTINQINKLATKQKQTIDKANISEEQKTQLKEQVEQIKNETIAQVENSQTTPQNNTNLEETSPNTVQTEQNNVQNAQDFGKTVQSVPQIQEETVGTNIGNIPIAEYRDIMAQQAGFNDYADMRRQGYKLGNKYDVKVQEVQEAQVDRRPTLDLRKIAQNYIEEGNISEQDKQILRETIDSATDAEIDGDLLHGLRNTIKEQEKFLNTAQNNNVEIALTRAMSNKDSKGKTILGKINDFAKNKIQQLLGKDVSNRQHVLNDNDIRHMLKEHGNPEVESRKGQIAVTEEDIKKIPDILENPTDIVIGTKNKDGDAIRYVKQYEDNNTFVVEVVPDKGNNLIIKTMWKKPIALADNLIPASTSETQGNLGNSTSNINNIIPTSQNYVNNQQENILPSTEQLKAQDLKQGEEAYNTLNMGQQEDGLKEAIENIAENKQANKVSYTNDFYRNMRNALGEKAGKELTGKFDASKLKHVKMRQKLSNELKSYIVDELGIKLGSEMSADVQKYGEKLITEAELKRKYPNNWQNIIKADKWFRSKYDELIDGINETRKEIYPHVEEKIQETKDALLKTYDLIKQAEKTQIAPYKIDQDIQENIKRLDERIAAKQEKIKEIEDKNRPNYESTKTYTNLVEQLELLEDNKKELERLIGKRYDEKVAKLKRRAQRLSDTLNGEELWRGKRIPKRDNYYRHFQEMTEGFKALHNIFTTPAEISSQLAGTSEYTKPKSKFLGLAQKRTTNETQYDAVGGFLNYLEPASYAINIDPFITELRDLTQTIKNNTTKTKNANKLTTYLDDFAGSLAGKTNKADRWLQDYTNRKTMKAIEWTANRIKSNAILGNISSSISQILNLPQVVGKIKDPVKLVQGVYDLASGNGKYQDSQFIQERYHNDIMSQFKTKLIQQPKKFATWMLGALDEGVTKAGWNAVYRQAIENGIENPIQYADDTMRNLVAGRGIGERTLAQESKLTNLLMPFTVETGNYWRVMKDFVREKDFGGILITFIIGWLLNKGIEKLGASGKTFDPIDAIYDAFTEEDITPIERVGRVGGEILSSMPLGQQIASIYPEYGADFGIFELPSREKLFGSNDPTRFGTGNILSNTFSPAIPGTPIPSIALPWGGTQLKRTVEGAKALKKGGDYKTTTAGEKQLKFPINMEDLTTTQKFLKSAQVLTLGKYSVPEADYYFENGGLSKVQTEGLEKAKDLDISVKEFYDIMEKIEAIEVPKRKNKEGKEEAIPGARKKLIIEELNKTDLNNEQRKLMYDIFYSKELK